MSEFTRIAVTVPTETYTLVERLRRRLGKSRSAVVALALEEWLRSADMADADRRYIEGYARIPEAVDEVAAVAAQATSHWDTWVPGAPLRAADSSKSARSQAGRRKAQRTGRRRRTEDNVEGLVPSRAAPQAPRRARR